jgi:transcriptional regulator with XRE-family HTH domain
MNRLKAIRTAKNMSGIDVAEAINITPQYYYELEKGKKRLNEDLLRKLAALFDCTIDHILNFSPPSQSNISTINERVSETPTAFLNTHDGCLTIAELEEIVKRAVKSALEERAAEIRH